MRGAGDRDKLIEFLRPTTVLDDHGGEEDAGSAILASAWARVTYGSGQERREAAQHQARQTATFECLWSAELAVVRVTDKIGFAGAEWDIAGAVPVGLNREMHFTATKAA